MSCSVHLHLWWGGLSVRKRGVLMTSRVLGLNCPGHQPFFDNCAYSRLMNEMRLSRTGREITRVTKG